MASVLLPPPPVAPVPEKEAPVADHNNGNGFGGGNFNEPNNGPNYGPDWQPDPDFDSERCGSSSRHERLPNSDSICGVFGSFSVCNIDTHPRVAMGALEGLGFDFSAVHLVCGHSDFAGEQRHGQELAAAGRFAWACAQKLRTFVALSGR